MDSVPLDASVGVRTNSLLHMRGRRAPGPTDMWLASQGIISVARKHFCIEI